MPSTPRGRLLGGGPDVVAAFGELFVGPHLDVRVRGRQILVDPGGENDSRVGYQLPSTLTGLYGFHQRVENGGDPRASGLPHRGPSGPPRRGNGRSGPAPGVRVLPDRL